MARFTVVDAAGRVVLGPRRAVAALGTLMGYLAGWGFIVCAAFITFDVIARRFFGFSSQATYTPEIHPKIVWAKFQAMAEGARLASEQLWR